MLQQLKIGERITPRNASTDQYLKEIGKINMLTVDEEVELATQIQFSKNVGLRNRLVEANTRFAVSVAKQYQGNGLPLDDLINLANIGLITAADRFDPTRGFKFITYAVNWIRQSIMQGLHESARTVHMPQNRIAFLTKMSRERDTFAKKNERQPTNEELADILNVSVEKIFEFRDSFCLSLNRQIGQEPEDTLMSMIPQSSFENTDKSIVDEFSNKLLAEQIDKLDIREAEIIRLRFGINCAPQSLYTIAEKLDITPERVRQLERKSLKILKSRLKPIMSSL